MRVPFFSVNLTRGGVFCYGFIVPHQCGSVFLRFVLFRIGGGCNPPLFHVVRKTACHYSASAWAVMPAYLCAWMVKRLQ